MLLEELALLSKDAAGIYIEIPSYLGFLEENIDEIAEVTHSEGALFILGMDPTSLGLIKSPGAFNADIAIGEGQPLGLGINFGGPLLGLFTCKKEYLRQMPGRIIGLTTSASRKKAYCMALQTREQHIRREKATSNICTNNALCAIATAVYLSLLGPSGIQKLSEILYAKTCYTIQQLKEIPDIKVPYFDASHFKEFTLNFDNTPWSVDEINEQLLKKSIHGGKNLKHEFPELGESMLLCVTEVHNKSHIDHLTANLTTLLSEVKK
jgi:glycine dehydrogenase subunit 1